MGKNRLLGLASATLVGAFILVAAWVALHGAATAATSSPAAATAETHDVVINEVAWMGTAADHNDEWIELYNATDAPITLTN